MSQDSLARQDAPPYLSISDYLSFLNGLFQEACPEVRIEGEISVVVRAASGHLYITLKDERAQTKIVIWKGDQHRLEFKPEAGMVIRCHGTPNIFGGTGQFQLKVTRAFLAGEGELQRKFNALKEKLNREGLFDRSRKRALPTFPLAIGIVTSGTGAVIHDIMVRIKERMPVLSTYLVDVRVQGNGAAEEIAQGIELLNEYGKVDVIIVARGGGSLEDLWQFNEERVARAIFASQIPVVSGVGHEVDITLADLVADVRAPTPTAAAEIVVPKRSDLLKSITEFERRVLDYDRWFQPLTQRIDELSQALSTAGRTRIHESVIKLGEIQTRLADLQPRRLIERFRSQLQLAEGQLREVARSKTIQGSQNINEMQKRLSRSAALIFERGNNRINAIQARVDTVNPYAILRRGYSIIEKNGKVVRSSATVSRDDELKLIFGSGGATAVVKETVSGKD